MIRFSRVCLLAVLFAGPAWSQDAQRAAYTADETQAMVQMRALQDEIGPGKRAFVEQQLALPPQQMAKFWPVYEAHQQALSAFNKRRLDNILAYARQYNAGSLDDASATKIAEEALRLEKDEAAQMERTFKSLKGAVPAVKAAQYLQVESKLRAVLRYQQAAQIPFAE